MKKTQREKILDYIREHGSISSWEAYRDLGITQLGARLDQLKKEGYYFETKWAIGDGENKKPYKKYFLLDMEHIPSI